MPLMDPKEYHVSNILILIFALPSGVVWKRKEQGKREKVLSKMQNRRWTKIQNKLLTTASEGEKNKRKKAKTYQKY